MRMAKQIRCAKSKRWPRAALTLWALTLCAIGVPLRAVCPGFTRVGTMPAAGTNPLRIASGDFNGDGKGDVVVTNIGNSVAVLLGNGDGTFASRVNYGAGFGENKTTVADLNGDGKPDLLVSGQQGVAVLLNNGNGTFATRVFYGANAYSDSVAGDFNGDNKVDLVTSDPTNNTLVFLPGNGNGTFGTPVINSIANRPLAIIKGDFNNDGKLDIASTDDIANTVSIYLGNGNGTFAAPFTTALGSNTSMDIVAADLNHDGKLDVITANYGGGISVFLGVGDGSLGTATVYGSGDPFYALVAVDLNNDGNLDIACASVDTNSAEVLTGTGTGAFAAPVQYSAAAGLAYPHGITAIDLNGDLSPDLATANYNSNNVTAFLNGCTTTPTISTVAPNAGPSAGGQSVVITGTNLSGASSVKFGGTSATITNNTATTITVTTAAHAAATVDVVAVVTTGTVTATNAYTYADPPTVTGAAPASGPAGGGQSGVVITGTNLATASSVSFSGSSATITNKTATTVTVTTAAHAAGLVDITVTTGGGSATATGAYTYIAAPTISGVAPNAGPTAGGQTGVVISGTNLTGATSVTFGGTAATITNTTATAITVTTPAHAAGQVTVAVTTPGGTASSANAYRYAAAPTVTTVAPNSGPSAGGQTGIVITGTNLTSATGVTFDGLTATITANTSTTVTVTTPAHAAGAVNVVVTTAGGSATKTNGFTYVDAPTFGGIAPSAGPTAGGQTGVVISGTNLSSATSVKFATSTATITNNTATAITVTTPAHAAGAVNVVITTAGGTATGTNAYTYVSAPTISSVSPNLGPAAGGQTGVVISGTNLSNATGVTLGGAAATITNNVAGSITVTTPPHAAGAVNVVVTTAGGSATSTNGYTYVAAPSISGISPNSGPSAGGQTGVVISGSNLSSATGVTFGGTPATITNNTAGSITVTTPPHAAGGVSVVVTTAGGTATDAYTYLPGAATRFDVGAPATATAGVALSFTVTAYDALNNVATSYSGAAHFTSSDGAATLPPDSTLTNGTGTFNATLVTAGSRTITATDGAVTGTSGPIIVSPAAPTHFAVAAPAAATAGSAFSFTVTALDTFNNTVTAYGGSAHFTSSDGTATLPADSPLTNGSGTFSATLRVAGPQTITATDGGISGTSNTIAVAAASATHFVVSAPAAATAGNPFSFTVTALDVFNNVATGYAGAAHFTSSDGSATLPADSPLTSGAGTFSVTLYVAASQTITATDGPVSGTSNAIAVAPAAASHFTVTAPPSATAGSAFSFTVTALDTFNNIATGYTGAAHFTSSDGSATLSGDSALTNGAGTFNATLRIAGPQTITATDGPITGTSGSIAVTPAAATHFAVSAPSSATAGSAFSFTVTALDGFNNTATAYAGRAHFTSNDGAATLPADSTLAGGSGTFSATLRTSGAHTITAADGAITGTSNAIAVSSSAATHFAVSTPGSATAGSAFSVSVTALDNFNNTVTSYAGTVHFTATDGTATLPADSTLTAGTGSFSATLRTAGTQTITAADGAVTGTSGTITVSPAAPAHFAVSAPASVTAGSAFSVTVTVLDTFNNTVTGYGGTAHFTSSDPTATLPPDSTLTNGTGSFSTTLRTAGAQTVTVTDGAITGTSGTIAVAPAATSHFTVSAPAAATAGSAFSFTVTALDAFNNTATAYAGNVHFTSTDGAATLPTDSTLTGGSGTFSATLRTAGTQTITATDGPITGTSSAIAVSPSAATHFAVSAPAAATAGNAFTFTVTALDAFNNTAAGYAGFAHFTSTDGSASLPADSTLTNGTATLSATLRTAGTRTITASDGAVTGTSGPITVSPAAPTHFMVSAPASATAGSAFSVTVTVLDTFNNTVTGYGGTAHFTSSDATATLPPDSTLTNGTGSFSTTLRTAGAQTITATDGAITGTSGTIAVAPAATSHFTVSAPASATAGGAFSFTVTALDDFANTTPAYSGSVHFTATDGTAALPVDSTLTAGSGTFSATLHVAGTQTITAADGGLTGTSNTIAVSPSAATHFAVSAPAAATAGSPFTFTVTALDAFDNIASAYAGTAHFTSSDGSATLPADSTLTSGTRTFNATLRIAGSQTITATDGAVTGTSNSIAVAAAAATHFTVSAPAAATAGSAFSFTVTALDSFNNVAVSYAGSAHFTSTDGAATLPSDSTLVSGVRTFSATLRTTGTRTIAAADGTITGISNSVVVSSSAATHFAVSAPATATAGSTFSLTVTALDAFDNTVTAYASSVHFTSTDPGASLPGAGALTNGTATFTATLRMAGSQTITGGDGAISGTSGPIAVNPAAPTHAALSAPATATAGSAFSLTLTVLDDFNNTVTSYGGTLHFTSSDGSATLPADTTLINGTGTFNATLRIAGSQTISAADGAINGTSNTIAVAPAAASHVAVTAPVSATAGSAFAFTVTALDDFANTVTAYAGTLHFTSSDGSATVPADNTLTNGIGTFNATLRLAGPQTITATDGPIHGTSNTIAVSPSAATHFAVAAPASATAGSALTFTVTALDTFNNVAAGYTGAAHFTSTDGSATLSSDSTLTSGTGTFSATLRTAGTQTIAVADGAITGTSGSISVGPATATHFTVTAPAAATAGNAFTFTVTALDTFNNTATAFAGTLHFTSTDAGASLPADSTLTNGAGTFSATLRTAGSRTITATSGAVSGTSAPVAVSPATASHFTVTAPASANAGVAFSITITALDAFNNTATAYAGAAHFTSSDGAATLPADSALANGVGTFSATLRTAGSRTITAADGAISGNATLAVIPAAATHFAVAAPGSATAGTPFSFTVTALDAFENTATAYAGTAHFTSSDSSATLPAGSPLSNGTGTFSATLRTAGSQTITSTDGAVTGSSKGITVAAAAATHFALTVPSSATSGSSFSFTVTALDTFGNTATFGSALHFTSSDGNATLPADSTLTAGTGTFSAVLRTLGTQTVSATSGAVTGTSAPVPVIVGSLHHFRVDAAGGGAIGAQVAGVPFPIRITALDVNSNVVTSFNGTAAVSSSAVLLLGAGNTAAFTNGILATHLVTVGSGGSATITATSGAFSGTSNTFAVSESADLAVTLTGTASAPAGKPVTYTLTVRNMGPSTAHAPVVTFELPAGWPLVSASSPCGGGSPCMLADLAPSAIATIQIASTIPANASPDSRYNITATAASLTADPSSANNQATTRTTVAGPGCPSTPAAIILGAIAEVSSGATYHVMWSVAGVESYELQEATDPSFAGAVTIPSSSPFVAFQHEVAVPTAYYYRVRAVVTCLGELPFTAAARVVVQPRQAGDNHVLDLMVESGTSEVLSQTIHLPAPAGANSANAASAVMAFAAASDQPWLTVSPISGSVPPAGIDVTLRVNTSGRMIGTSVATAHLAMTDGTPLADMRVNLNVGAMMTAQPRTLPIPANSVLLPAVAHTPGPNALWQSDVRLFNPSAGDAEYLLSFTPSGADGTQNGSRVTVDVPARGTAAFDDIVRHLFGYGAAAGESSIGSLEVRPGDGNASAVVTSRTYAVTPGGTYGQAIPPFSAPNFAAKGMTLSLQHLAQSGAYRTNVGLIEGSGRPATATLGIFGDDGAELTHFDVTLGPLEQRQINSMLTAHGVAANDARIEVTPTSEEGLVGAYASVVDNITSDPTLVPAVRPELIDASRFVVAGVADFDTGRNVWRTDVRIYNASRAAVTADLTFFPQGASTTTKSVTIAPGEVKAFDSILRSFFGMSGTGGALHVVTSTPAHLVVTARTYDASGAGTYGQFIPAVTAADATALGEHPLDILQLEQSSAYRANVGLVEVAGQPAHVDVTATLADGRTASTSIDLQPFQFLQFGSMLQTLGFDSATNARLTLRVTGGTGRVTGYASIIDNRTGDPTYMLAR